MSGPNLARAQQLSDEAARAPIMSLAVYIDALEAKDIELIKSMIDQETLRVFDPEKFTEDRMKLEAQTYRNCFDAKVKIHQDRAVVFYSADQKICSPYFMIFENGKWKLDLVTMAKVLMFNKKNEWKPAPNVEHPYLFAFTRKSKQ